MIDLALTPSGHLFLWEAEGETKSAMPISLADSFRSAFKKDPCELLVNIAASPAEAPLPPALAFWRGLGERYLTALCHIPEPGEALFRPLPPPEDLATAIESAPAMRGAEYLRPETLSQWWKKLDEYVRAEIAAQEGGLAAWLRRRGSLWCRVGRVCFHLAENKRDPEYPFAFLATYAPKLLDGRRVQYVPLGRALEEYAGAKNKGALVNLLAPVQRASEKCGWVKGLVDSGEVFHPLAWTPKEAHRFLCAAPVLEESGLLVRAPDWWTRRPSRVRVGISIGEAGSGRFSAESMLDFKIEGTLDGQTLSPREWQEVLNGADGLVLLKGKWVEVDRAKLKHALEHWKRVEKAAGKDGISFLQGMRLLAGAPLESSLEGLVEGDGAEWSEVRAGPWLEERLRQIRQPGTLREALPGAELRATLRPYQELGVKWLSLLSGLNLGACLADDMGLGKTIQVLALLLLLKNRRTGERKTPALLVLPASLLANWKSEIERFAPSLVCRYAHPSMTPAAELKVAAADPEAYLAGADVVLTTYGMLARMEWLVARDWSLAVVDEAQAIKNPAARQTRTVKRLKAQARIALTGTPVENRLSDLWSIFDFLCPGLLGSMKAFGAFVKRMDERTPGQYAPLRKLAGPYILRRLKTDKSIIDDLPDKVELQAYCNLSKKQAALYEQAVLELGETLKIKSGIERRGAVLAFILRFKQICNHPAQWLGTGEYGPGDSGKFQRLGGICGELAERQERALVFTQFRQIAEPLAHFLCGVFGRPGLVLHGGTETGKRKKMVDEFQGDGGPPFLVLSLKAGGTGLNLTAATHVIHFDRWWNPAVENQATDRAFRIGQKKNVMVHKFVCRGTVEEKIDALIRDKTVLAGEILEGGAPNLITEMNDKDLLEMVKLDINAALED